jgi:dTDP-3-amino-3,4,6-trideoxy-alpha-D-glucose transaminase
MRPITFGTTASTSPRAVAEQTLVPFLDVRAAIEEIRPAVMDAVARVIDSGRFIGGDELAAFEEEWATYCGALRCVGTANGLDALTLALRALDVGPGDEVIVPAYTFIATWLAVSAAGATPVPVEPDPGTMNIDPERITSAIGPRTRAIVPVHLYGQPADMDAIARIASAATVHIVEDAAQAHGAAWGPQRAGGLGTVSAFSFYPAKNLGALGDAGAVVTSDETLADAVRVLGNYGARQKYDHDVAGVNSRLDPMQAAILRVRLRALDEWNERRREVARRYLQEFRDLPWLTLPSVRPEANPVWHLFVVRCEDRDGLREHLAARGVETGLHYPSAPHRSGAYRHLGHHLPIADRLAAGSVSLPIGPHMTAAQVDQVVGAVRAHRPAVAVRGR